MVTMGLCEVSMLIVNMILLYLLLQTALYLFTVFERVNTSAGIYPLYDIHFYKSVSDISILYSFSIDLKGHIGTGFNGGSGPSSLFSNVSTLSSSTSISSNCFCTQMSVSWVGVSKESIITAYVREEQVLMSSPHSKYWSNIFVWSLTIFKKIDKTLSQLCYTSTADSPFLFHQRSPSSYSLCRRCAASILLCGRWFGSSDGRKTMSSGSPLSAHPRISQFRVPG